ncbi:MAG: DUF4838 domain-containing protein [Lentisphaerae bacterium]|nr:DUF4838 domain-containing protein [Lentisphaerota bacterium]MBT4816757.1 DUF4838 domain-containing protein [Lentisphaerota bacterium]MBT5612535.1 DUF4838 domain-containing protein [Lentisphaerota bacterium]MBT7061330.1 DUF4838 domain-containing protein [Lentisphaerota bacterium]MBT7840471.1 DUF4838 domain-containing protein [Lentisphaerota bacterium]
MRRLYLLCWLPCLAVATGQTYRVVGPREALPHESTAVKELQDYLARRVKGDVTIGGRRNVVFQVGDTDLARENGLLSSQLPEEEWHIKSFGNQVLLNGGGTRGALYAVYHFLEDYCDVHWWSEYEDYVPPAGPVELPALDTSGKPAFLYRDLYRTHYPADAVHFAVRIRLNRSGDIPIPAEYGGSFNYGPPYHCHTFDKYVPATKHLEASPELFSLHKGKRVGGQRHGQLCLTNEALKPVFLDSLREYIRKGEENARKQGLPLPRIYDVSQNDNRRFCECERCMDFVAEHGHSGLYLTFVNWLAGEIAEEHPHVYISTLAYHYSEPPPTGGVRAAPNVVVKLTDTLTNQAASVLEEENKVFKEFVEQWKGFADHLFIWDYAITFSRGLTGLPFASEFYYGDLYRHYRANNVSGVFWEHENPHLADMYELKVFMESKLMEDPDQNVEALIGLFMDRYYGPAAPHILAYRHLVDAARKRNGGVVRWFPKIYSFDYLQDDDIAAAHRLFEQAESAVRGDPLLSAHVRRARTGLDRLTCLRGTASLCYRDKDSKVEQTKTLLDVRSAGNRLAESWPAWAERYTGRRGEPRGALKAVNAQLAKHNRTEVPLASVPERFRGRAFYDFNAGAFENHSPQAVSLVSDPDSPCGYAFRSDVKASHYYKLPFVIGFYDQGARKGITSKTFKQPLGEPGYNWYQLGPVTIPKDGYVYTSRAWTTKLQTGVDELVGKTFDIWVSAKLSGPHFRPGSTGSDHIWIDRIVLLEPEASQED